MSSSSAPIVSNASTSVCFKPAPVKSVSRFWGVRFGEEMYRDRVDISSENFYRRLVAEPTLPSTTQPTPNDFAEVYRKLAGETDEVLVITVSSKMSGTYQSAIQASEMVRAKCRILVIDCMNVATAEGLIVIATAEAVKRGAGLDEAAALASRAMARVHLVAYFDTLKYLAKGGRIGKAQGLLGSMLSVKPILTIRDGEMAPLTRVRSMTAGLDYLYKFATGFADVEMLAVEHGTTPGDADKIAERLKLAFPGKPLYRSSISPVVGTYAGPNAIALTVLEAEKK